VQEAWCGDRLLVTGKIKVGCIGVTSLRPSAIPADVLQLINA
jgi:acyl-CoA thioester hydrolase